MRGAFVIARCFPPSHGKPVVPYKSWAPVELWLRLHVNITLLASSTTTTTTTLQTSHPAQTPTTMYHTLISALALGKISLGVGGMLGPSLINQAFLITAPSSTAVLTRLFASREVALGGLLWMSRIKGPTAATATAATPTFGLRHALLAGMVADSLDVLGAGICFAQGSLDWKQTLVLGLGGTMAAGWGGLCLKGIGRVANKV